MRIRVILQTKFDFISLICIFYKLNLKLQKSVTRFFLHPNIKRRVYYVMCFMWMTRCLHISYQTNSGPILNTKHKLTLIGSTWQSQAKDGHGHVGYVVHVGINVSWGATCVDYPSVTACILLSSPSFVSFISLFS